MAEKAAGLEEQVREAVAIGTPLGLSAKAQRMEQGSWAATPGGESAGERSSQTQRSSHQTEVLTDEVRQPGLWTSRTLPLQATIRDPVVRLTPDFF